MNKILTTLCVSTLFLCGLSHSTHCLGDEYVLDTNTLAEEVRLGDFQCSSYRAGSVQNFRLPGQTGSDITTGELWTFFEDQGLSSVNQLVLCLDVEPLSSDQYFGLESFELRIEDSNATQDLQQFSLGNNSLVLPGSETASNRAECRLVVNLGYDFMKKYSSSSSDRVSLHLATDKEGRTASFPIVFIEGRRNLFTVPNMILLAVFCLFWIAVFWILKRLTLPVSVKEAPAPQVRTVMSLRSLSVASTESVG